MSEPCVVWERPVMGTLRALALSAMVAVVAACGNQTSTDPGDTAGGDTVPVADGESSTGSGVDQSAEAPSNVVTLDIPDEAVLPIVFVHGFAGSAQQYESQAMRFAANGYPLENVVSFEHDGAGMDIDGYAKGLADMIDDTLDRFDAEQVYLVGHSRGTFVSSSYLAEPARAVTVAKYISLDGRPCPEVEVDCLAITQNDLPGQAHVEVATSPESFAKQFEFLFGVAPETTQTSHDDGSTTVTVNGRAVNFPANTGRAGASLRIFEIDSATGLRLDETPTHSIELGADGAFGPIELAAGQRYEYSLVSDDSSLEHHLYLPALDASSNFVRLLSSDDSGSTRLNTHRSPDHVALILMRMREWYADGPNADVVEIGVPGQPTSNVVAPFLGNGSIGIHVHDDAASPQVSTLGPLEAFANQPFQGGVDLFIATTDPQEIPVTIRTDDRGTGDGQWFSLPRWPSSEHIVTVMFSDVPPTNPTR